MLRLVQHVVVKFLLLWVLRGKNSNKAAADIVIPFVSLSLKLLSDLIPLALTHRMILVLSAIELFCLIPLGLSFAFLA